MTRLGEDSAEETALADAIAEYVELRRRGAAPSIASFARAHPEIESSLRNCLGVLDTVPVDDTPLAEAPRELGDFRLVRMIGSGGMGVVYEAEQKSLPRTVALKLLQPGGLASPERLARFRREIEVTAKLRHPNIVPVYEAGEASGTPWYAMPLLRGRSLDQWVHAAQADAASSPLASREALVAWIARFIDVARALSEAHAAGILHRDIKPSNLFLEDDGRLLILDFGLTRSMIETGASLTGAPVGTPRYMSPEQILARKQGVDGRTDLFSLAATMYELLTLRPAFPGEDREAIFRAILASDPVPPRRIDPRVPRDLEVVLLKALEKEAARRYASAAELADDLQRFLDYEPVRARPVGMFARLARLAQRNPAAATATFAAAALAIALPAYFAVQWLRERAEIARRLDRANELLAAGDAEGARDAAVGLESLDPGNGAAQSVKQAALAALREKAEQQARVDADRRAASEIDAARHARARLAQARAKSAELANELRDAESRVPSWAQLTEKASWMKTKLAAADALEEGERAFREAHSHLLSALQLVPDSKPARRELASLAFDEYLEAEAARDRARMATLAPLVETYDDGELRERWIGAGTLALDSDPAGAEVKLFRCEERDLRSLPLPCSLEGALEAGAAARPSPLGPWVTFAVDSVESEDDALRSGDELVTICGNPPLSAEWTVRHLSTPHRIASEPHVAFLMREGSPRTVELDPRTTVKLGGKLSTKEANSPDRDGAASAGRTPLAAPKIAMGSYLAVLHLDGFADARVPFVIGRSEHEELRVKLLTPEQVGEGYAYVPAGKALLGGDPDALASLFAAEVDVAGFCMQTREVTFAEYFEFVRDLERTNPEAAQKRAPRGPVKSAALEPMWTLDAEDRIQPALPLDFDTSYPAFGVSWWDAKAYCAWLSEKSGETFDLPTEVEWEKAARGADGRLFTWGNTLEWTFARLGRSSKTTGPVPGGLYPTDESVYGIRDLGGNVREWVAGQPKTAGRRMRGGGWGTSVAGNCHAACRVDEKEPEFADLGTGFRVVKRVER